MNRAIRIHFRAEDDRRFQVDALIGYPGAKDEADAINMAESFLTYQLARLAAKRTFLPWRRFKAPLTLRVVDIEQLASAELR
jgi:hypothetical protein